MSRDKDHKRHYNSPVQTVVGRVKATMTIRSQDPQSKEHFTSHLKRWISKILHVHVFVSHQIPFQLHSYKCKSPSTHPLSASNIVICLQKLFLLHKILKIDYQLNSSKTLPCPQIPCFQKHCGHTKLYQCKSRSQDYPITMGLLLARYKRWSFRLAIYQNIRLIGCC